MIGQHMRNRQEILIFMKLFLKNLLLKSQLKKRNQSKKSMFVSELVFSNYVGSMKLMIMMIVSLS